MLEDIRLTPEEALGIKVTYRKDADTTELLTALVLQVANAATDKAKEKIIEFVEDWENLTVDKMAMKWGGNCLDSYSLSEALKKLLV